MVASLTAAIRCRVRPRPTMTEPTSISMDWQRRLVDDSIRPTIQHSWRKRSPGLLKSCDGNTASATIQLLPRRQLNRLFPKTVRLYRVLDLLPPTVNAVRLE